MIAINEHLSIESLNVWYGEQHVLKDITADIPRHRVTAIVGPSGCGKTTLLKALNRLLELTESVRVDGQVWLDGVDIYNDELDVTVVRTRIGLLAQKPHPLPMSIYDNVAYGPRIHRRANGNLDDIVKRQLQAAGLWDEVKDRLRAPAADLSVGQQQRLCLARALAVEPDILLCDESTSALDPISSKIIENLFRELKKHYTIILVTHVLRQAKRLADHVVFMYYGEIIEQGNHDNLINHEKSYLV